MSGAFASANVSGLFFASMFVVDENYVHLSYIDHGTDARHIIKIENISGLDQNVEVEASLPHGRLRVEFIQGNTATDTWVDVINGIPDGGVVDFEREVRRTGQLNHPHEPIRCDDVKDARGSFPFLPGRTGVPFQMYIEVR